MSYPGIWITIMMQVGALLSEVSTPDSTLPIRYGTDQLEEMGKHVPIDSFSIAKEVRDTLLLFDFNGIPSRIDIRDGVVEHIGYRIFPEMKRDFTSCPVFDFLERYAMCSDLPLDREHPSDKQIAIDGLEFDGMSFGDLKKIGRDSTDFYIRSDDYRTYTVVWTHENQPDMSVKIPINYNLLRGVDMAESELRLFGELSDTLLIDFSERSLAENSVSKDQLTGTWKPNNFILKGDKFMTDGIRSDRYYQPDTSMSNDSKFELLYDESYPVESISNLLTGIGIDNSYEVELKMIAYPMEPRTIRVPLSRMVFYFISRGCELFAGLTSMSDSSIQYVMVCKNAAWGYCHSMKITVTYEKFEDKSGEAKAKITPYIPLPKILNLFSEN